MTETDPASLPAGKRDPGAVDASDGERGDERGSRRTRGAVAWLSIGLGAIGFLFAIHQTFNLQLFGVLLINTAYYYLLLAIFLSLAFLIFPARRRDRDRVPWYDWALFTASVAGCLYLAVNGERIRSEGWDIVAPFEATAIGGVICVLVLEGLRRTAGLPLFVICAVFFLFPLYSDAMPGFLWGPSFSLPETLRAHSMGVESIIGVPLRVAADLLLGFLIFGSALAVTGGGEFFMNFAFAVLGRSRGGPAKVGVLSSGLFGSLSGSIITNVVTTGQLTIPTMKRIGYPATYAGAVEACASTGGALMPPVMGAAAFVMAEFLDVPYRTVVIAAAMPAVLYYLALMLQTDNYAARHGLRGQAEEEIPNVWAVLKDGWYYLFSLAMLTYMLLVMRIESYAPYYATAVLLLTTVLRRRDRFGLLGLKRLVQDATTTTANLIAILAGVGMIVGSFSYTGVGGAFSRELLQFAGGNVYLLLLFGAITSFILGMGMTTTACYIFLAIVLGPALISSGLDPVASHLFILYWGILANITPPVALAAVAAASIAKSNAMMTGFYSMRLGLITFVLPFLFVLHPELILRGDFGPIVIAVGTAGIAVWLMASAFEGYLYGVGRIDWPLRAPLLLGAAAFLYPGWLSDVVGATVFAAVYALAAVRRRASRAAL